MAEVSVSIVMERVTASNNLNPESEEVYYVRGIEEELSNISLLLETIRNVLYDAERRRLKEKPVDEWLLDLEQTCDVMEDFLDEWEHSVLKLKRERESIDAVVAPFKRKVRSFIRSPGLYLTKSAIHRNLTKRIRIMDKRLHRISLEKDLFRFVMPDPTASHAWQVPSTSDIQDTVYGREEERKYIVYKLVASGLESGIQVLSIVGMGGLGKTTLAQLVYNDSQVCSCFDLRLWVYVSHSFDEVGIAKKIIESVGKVNATHLDQGLVLQHLRDSISGRKFLLVLDDVCNADHDTKWEDLINSLTFGGVGSRVLVTTRNSSVAWMMSSKEDYIFQLRFLSEEDSWSLFHERALLGRNEDDEFLQHIGMRLVKRCGGLPLAIKTLGGVLRFKNTRKEWESVLMAEIWKDLDEGPFHHFQLSYNELSPILKYCFSYFSFFPEASWIDVGKLIENWIALGYLGSSVGSGSDMELVGALYFKNLTMSSLVAEVTKTWDGQIRMCKMHGLMHSFTQYLRERRNVDFKQTTCQVCDSRVVATAKLYRSLVWDTDHSFPTTCGCLRGLRVLWIRGTMQGIPRGVDNLINLRWLEVIIGHKLSREDAKTICRLTKLQFLRFYVEEVPIEIENLVHLRLLDPSSNKSLTELPESICDLHELRTLNIKFCTRLSKLPQGIHMLTNLQHLLNLGTICLKQFPEGVAQLAGLRTLNEYCGGSGWSKLGWLKDLNRLEGFLSLKIRLGEGDHLDEVVRDAQMAELKKKEHIEGLHIIFEDEMADEEASRVDVLDALQPHQHLKELDIWLYNGLILPDWITSLGSLRSIKLYNFNHLSSLPSLGMLPLLEEIYMAEMHGLQYVGPEFLGISTISSSVAFPCLKELTFNHCPKWKVWVDITPEEGEYADVQLMPQLIKMTIIGCPLLNALPPRLLRKASLSAKLNLVNCTTQLQRSCWDMDSSATASTSLVPDMAEVQTQAQAIPPTQAHKEPIKRNPDRIKKPPRYLNDYVR